MIIFSLESTLLLMKLKIWITILFAIVCISVFYTIHAHTDVSQPILYDLIWEENFNSRTLNKDIWGFMQRRESDCGRYFSSNSNIYRLRNGYLRLYAHYNKYAPNDTAKILTAGLETFRRLTISYGKVEVRARIKGAQGAWPAIWLRGVDERHSTYPDYAEIDIMEHLNYDDKVYQTVHSNYTDVLLHHNHPKYSIEVDVNPSKFNVYSVEILPNMLIFSVNGNETFRYPKIKTEEYGQYPFGCPMHLMIDMQYGGKWVGHTDISTLPAYMDIDWVKIYKAKLD